MKSNKEILVSYCPPVTDKDGKLIFKNDGTLVRPSTGHPFEHRTLYDLLIGQQSLSKTAVKGSEGEIYAYLGDKLDIRGAEEAGKDISDGIIFIDIDKMSKDDVTTIYNAFDKIVVSLPNVLTCWYSNSYYNSDKEYGGLHFILRVSYDTISSYEYKYYVTLYGAILSRVIYNICNIDIRPNGKGLDHVTKRISQRFYLNFSEIKWNDNAFPIDPQLDELQKEELYVWVNTYDKWFVKESDYKVVSCEITKFNWDKVLSSDFKVNTNGLKTDQLGHERRITIENFLAGLGWEFDDIVEFMMCICYGKDFAGGKTKLLNAIKQTTRTAISKFRGNPSATYSAAAKNILTALGVDIEADIERIYQPIDFDFDSIFLDAYESLKDYTPINKFYNPDNFIRIKLQLHEYLKDYKDTVMDAIYKHAMTYLIADCMTGKTTLALDAVRENGLFDDDDNFIIHVHGESVDICVPYNSVADNKAKDSRSDIKRVVTANISNFSVDKRNVFIWNTIMPLYDKYFKDGVVKRAVLFFDESQKIVTDDYRWEIIFEMFKVLPMMYKHFVFMTGTPAGELQYLKQYFNDYCIIKVDKDVKYKRECKFLKYDKFGFGDRIELIEECISNGRLPLIYTNARRAEWREAIKRINRDRLSCGLRPYKVLEYSRDNKDQLKTVDKTNSIKGYDIVIATKYCSVGIDFQKDDRRMRTAIIDYAGESDCTFHDIWQFTLRNRNQDTITKIIVKNGEEYDNKLFNYCYYVDLFDDIAKLHTHKITDEEFNELHNAEDEIEGKNFDFINSVFLARKFGRYTNVKNNYFKDARNVKLLSVYYLYVKIFSNIRVIKNMLERRGVEVVEIDMTHSQLINDSTVNKEIYKFFVDNFETISNINANKEQYTQISYLIDINGNQTEFIEDNKIYSRNLNYMNWLIKEFAGKDEWYNVLKENEYVSKNKFNEFNMMRTIAKRITTKEIDKINKYKEYMIEYGIDDLIVNMVHKHYGKVLDISKKDIRTTILLRDIIDSYRKILEFAVDNIEFIEEIKNAEDNAAWISAVHKMDIIMRQKEQEKLKVRLSNAKKKSITVIWEETKTEETFDSRDEFADRLGISKGQLSKVLNGTKSWSGPKFSVKNA